MNLSEIVKQGCKILCLNYSANSQNLDKVTDEEDSETVFARDMKSAVLKHSPPVQLNSFPLAI